MGPMGPVGFGDPFGGPMGPGGFGDPFGGPMGPGGFGDPFGGPMGPGGFGDPFGGPMGPGGFGDSFGGPMGPGGFGGDYYNEAPMEEYYFEDPSLYEYYVPPGEEFHHESESESGGGGGSGSGSTTFSGSNNADTSDKSGESVSWRFEGFSGNDSLIGGSAADTFWGAIGNDTLTGNGGNDIFYFGDNTEGTDTITDFNSSGSDILKFAQPFSGYYSRTAYATDTGATGTTYNIAANGNTLPKVINFTTDNSNYASPSQTAAFFSSLNITTDGTTPISGSESFIIVTGDGNHSAVYGWTDTGDGVISSSEIFSLALLSNTDNDTLSSANFAFGTI